MTESVKPMSEYGDAPRSVLSRVEATLKGMPRTSYFRVNRCLNVRVADEWPTSQVLLDDWHMILARGGAGTYVVEGTHVPLARGMLVVCTPGIKWQALTDPGDPVRIIPARFDVISQKTQKPARSKKNPRWFACTPRDVDHVEHLLKALHRAWSGGAPDRDGLCHATVQAVFGIVCQELRRRESGAFDARIERVRSHVERHPAHPNALEELAKRAQMSPDYFSRVFKNATGLSPKQYVMRTRMAYARGLLEDTGQSVKEVAATLDYPDRHAFSKQYEATFGVSPPASRRR